MPINNCNRGSYGVYAELSYWLRDYLKVIIGAQANRYETIKELDYVPRYGLVWQITPELNCKIMYSKAFRAPSLNEIGLDYFAMQGNPNLTSEHVTTLDAGVNYYGRKIQAGLNWFHSRISGNIYQDRSGATPTYMNGPKIIHQGIEAEAKYSLTDTLFLEGSTLYQDNKQHD